jgi:hypothetical protein
MLNALQNMAKTAATMEVFTKAPLQTGDFSDCRVVLLETFALGTEVRLPVRNQRICDPAI